MAKMSVWLCRPGQEPKKLAEIDNLTFTRSEGKTFMYELEAPVTFIIKGTFSSKAEISSTCLASDPTASETPPSN